eukprot:m.98230 g.98230  ORF g.98230 m.98230 type:complete len:255 (-) comp15268_c1_seq1:162-926(-)
MAAFHVLRVDFEPRDKHQADEPAKPQHQFFIRAHTSRKNDDTQFPSSRTLFVANLPLNPEEALSAVFSQFGNIHKCVLSWQSSRHESDIPDQYRNSPNSIVRRGRVQVAHIVYKKAKGVASALSCRFVKNSLPPPNPTGMEKWRQEFDALRQDPAELQAAVDAAVATFEDEQARTKAAALAKATTDDGWTVVTAKRKDEPAKPKKKKKKKELTNFYRFQRIEARKEQIAQLRRKFDEDKLRMAAMVQSRKFRPY